MRSSTILRPTPFYIFCSPRGGGLKGKINKRVRARACVRVREAKPVPKLLVNQLPHVLHTLPVHIVLHGNLWGMSEHLADQLDVTSGLSVKNC